MLIVKYSALILVYYALWLWYMYVSGFLQKPHKTVRSWLIIIYTHIMSMSIKN
jgi:hypothetical protein